MRQKTLKIMLVMLMSVAASVVCADEHEYVDLGLPSGTLWATCNVGANAPQEYGDYFAWGETAPKDDYSWNTYKLSNGSSSSMKKYCTNSSYGKVDNKTTLELSDDAANINWGGEWHVPSLEQLNELRSQCEWIHSDLNGVDGYLVKSKTNGNTIFLPTAGQHVNTSRGDDGRGIYWSSTLRSARPSYAHNVFFGLDLGGLSDDDNSLRYRGCSVRPVCAMIYVTSIVLNYSEYLLQGIGNNIQIEANVFPENAMNKMLTWSSSDEKIATVDANGIVTAVAQGLVTITASSTDGSGILTTCEITVIQPVSSIALNHETYTLEGVGKTVQLEPTVSPHTATNKEVTWKSFNESICFVTNGLVIATGYGTTLVMATTVDGGFIAYCAITVTDGTPVTDIEADKTDGAVYDLSGRQVTKPTRGIYIKDGKKMIAK